MSDTKGYTITISDAAYERLQRMLLLMDKDSRIPHAFTEGDIVALALSVMECCNKIDLDFPTRIPFNAGVAYFELERANGDKGE